MRFVLVSPSGKRWRLESPEGSLDDAERLATDLGCTLEQEPEPEPGIDYDADFFKYGW